MSDLEKFDEAYTDLGALTKGVDLRTLERDGSANPNKEVPGIDPPGGMKALHSLANVPKSWPLARLTIPLSAASKHLERLLEGCCNEIYVRNTNPDLQLHFVRKFAKDLVWSNPHNSLPGTLNLFTQRNEFTQKPAEFILPEERRLGVAVKAQLPYHLEVLAHVFPSIRGSCGVRLL